MRCYKKGTKAYTNPREWNWALMDYGSHLKKEVGNLNKKSRTYTKQSRFEGSRRQLRAGILKFILQKKEATTSQIIGASLRRDTSEVESLILELEQEGMIKKNKNTWTIA